MGFEDFCATGLSLGLASLQKTQDQYFHQEKKKTSTKSDLYFCPSLSLGLCSNDQGGLPFDESRLHGETPKYSKSNIFFRQDSSISGLSSFSNSSVKRERGESSEEADVEKERVSSKVINDDQDDQEELGGPRKKLRLTKDQSLILEDGFKEHSTLNPIQKQALAKRLNLRPRQVEVWFQNRRARTKLKQIEVDCEVLKKCCEKLTDENRRLQKEVQELRTLKRSTPPYCMQVPAGTPTICPSSEGLGGPVSHQDTSINNSKLIKPQFYDLFSNTHSSAAC